MLKKAILSAGLIAAAGMLAGVGNANAGVVNIGDGLGGSNPTGQLPPQDPVLLGDGSNISVYLNGSGTISTTMLIALLVPNDTTNLYTSDPFGAISVYADYPSLTNEQSGSSALVGNDSTFGLSSSPDNNGFWGSWVTNNSGREKLAGFLNQNHGEKFSSSVNGSNVSALESYVGVSDSTGEFGVYTVAISVPQALSRNALINVAIPGGLPVGTVVAGLTDNGNSTPWTNSGGSNVPQVPVVPAGPLPIPATLPLVGGGLLGLGALAMRRRRTL